MIAHSPSKLLCSVYPLKPLPPYTGNRPLDSIIFAGIPFPLLRRTQTSARLYFISNRPQLLLDFCFQLVRLLEQIRKFRGQSNHFFFKRFTIVFLFLNANITTRCRSGLSPSTRSRLVKRCLLMPERWAIW